MNILLVHNYYQQVGGEDHVFADEAKILRAHGHRVREFTRHNDAVRTMGRMELARKTLWNRESYDALRDATRSHAAQIVHFHNTLPLISPAGYRAAHDGGAAVVQTLHNYRLLCPAATFFRDGGVCEDCMKTAVPWPAVRYKCYRGSRSASAVIATMLTVHRALRTYRDEIDVFIALTEFARDKFIEGGLPAEKIIVKPNFVDPDPEYGEGSEGGALFVGRLTEEKGIRTLLKAWEHVAGNCILRIVGDGPLHEEVSQAAKKDPRIAYLGRQPLEKVCDIIGSAGVLVVPSLWYEGMPRTIVESFAKGTPVAASRLGSMASLVVDGRTGFHFEPGNAIDLARQVEQTLSSTKLLGEMRQQARLEFERYYSAERSYQVLMTIYDQAMRRAGTANAVNLAWEETSQ